MDIYDCRNEYDFYTRFATSVLQGTSSRIEHALESAKEFLGRLAPAISVSPDPSHEFSISLGIKPKNIEPETILSLPEKIARKKRAHIVICIDEFQQIGEFPDSLTVQKRLRGSWQHQQSTSYCLFGSKKHMMENIFQSRRMPFYMFGDTFYLKPIPTGEWIPFIQSRFASKGKFITAELAEKICSTVDNHSSYVQQLAWNVLLQTDSNATEQNLKDAVEELLNQCSSLFTQQTESSFRPRLQIQHRPYPEKPYGQRAHRQNRRQYRHRRPRTPSLAHLAISITIKHFYKILRAMAAQASASARAWWCCVRS